MTRGRHTFARWFGAAIVLGLLACHGRAATQQLRPDGPPYPPDRALETFRIAAGFQIEVFAAEPLVESPVAMDVDERGRLFVVEMPGYPLDVGGSGRITILADTNDDGKPDRRTVFADGLRLPTGVMRWKQGVHRHGLAAGLVSRRRATATAARTSSAKC